MIPDPILTTVNQSADAGVSIEVIQHAALVRAAELNCKGGYIHAFNNVAGADPRAWNTAHFPGNTAV